MKFHPNTRNRHEMMRERNIDRGNRISNRGPAEELLECLSKAFGTQQINKQVARRVENEKRVRDEFESW